MLRFDFAFKDGVQLNNSFPKLERIKYVSHSASCSCWMCNRLPFFPCCHFYVHSEYRTILPHFLVHFARPVLHFPSAVAQQHATIFSTELLTNRLHRARTFRTFRSSLLFIMLDVLFLMKCFCSWKHFNFGTILYIANIKRQINPFNDCSFLAAPMQISQKPPHHT